MESKIIGIRKKPNKNLLAMLEYIEWLICGLFWKCQPVYFIDSRKKKWQRESKKYCLGFYSLIFVIVEKKHVE